MTLKKNNNVYPIPSHFSLLKTAFKSRLVVFLPADDAAHPTSLSSCHLIRCQFTIIINREFIPHAFKPNLSSWHLIRCQFTIINREFIPHAFKPSLSSWHLIRCQFTIINCQFIPHTFKPSLSSWHLIRC